MPWASKRQMKWGHTPEGTKKLGGPKVVEEYDAATKNPKKLINRVKPKKKNVKK